MARVVTIRVNKEEVIKSVRNVTNKFGKARDNGTASRMVSVMQADDLGQDTRILDESFSKVVGDLTEIMSRYVSTRNGDDTITLVMPSVWRDHNEEGLNADCTRYAVNVMISDFLCISVPKEADVYLQKAVICSKDIINKLNDKGSPV